MSTSTPSGDGSGAPRRLAPRVGAPLRPPSVATVANVQPEGGPLRYALPPRLNNLPFRTSRREGQAPDMHKDMKCPRGDGCSHAHNVFEYWLHPSRYRTQMCNKGLTCKRKTCFFAHTSDELRVSDITSAKSDSKFELNPFSSKISRPSDISGSIVKLPQHAQHRDAQHAPQSPWPTYLPASTLHGANAQREAPAQNNTVQQYMSHNTQHEVPAHNKLQYSQREAPSHGTTVQQYMSHNTQHEAPAPNKLLCSQHDAPAHGTTVQQYMSHNTQHEAPAPNKLLCSQHDAPAHGTTVQQYMSHNTQHEAPAPNKLLCSQHDAPAHDTTVQQYMSHNTQREAPAHNKLQYRQREAPAHNTTVQQYMSHNSQHDAPAHNSTAQQYMSHNTQRDAPTHIKLQNQLKAYNAGVPKTFGSTLQMDQGGSSLSVMSLLSHDSRFDSEAFSFRSSKSSGCSSSQLMMPPPPQPKFWAPATAPSHIPSHICGTNTETPQTAWHSLQAASGMRTDTRLQYQLATNNAGAPAPLGPELLVDPSDPSQMSALLDMLQLEEQMESEEQAMVQLQTIMCQQQIHQLQLQQHDQDQTALLKAKTIAKLQVEQQQQQLQQQQQMMIMARARVLPQQSYQNYQNPTSAQSQQGKGNMYGNWVGC
eukprot:gene21559-28552_t